MSDAEHDGEHHRDARAEQRVVVQPGEGTGQDADADRVGHPRDAGKAVEDEEPAVRERRACRPRS